MFWHICILSKTFRLFQGHKNILCFLCETLLFYLLYLGVKILFKFFFWEVYPFPHWTAAPLLEIKRVNVHMSVFLDSSFLFVLQPLLLYSSLGLLYNPSPIEAETPGSGVGGQSELHSKSLSQINNCGLCDL